VHLAARDTTDAAIAKPGTSFGRVDELGDKFPRGGYGRARGSITRQPGLVSGLRLSNDRARNSTSYTRAGSGSFEVDPERAPASRSTIGAGFELCPRQTTHLRWSICLSPWFLSADDGMIPYSVFGHWAALSIENVPPLRLRLGQQRDCPAGQHRAVSIEDRSGTASRSRDRGSCPPRPY